MRRMRRELEEKIEAASAALLSPGVELVLALKDGVGEGMEARRSQGAEERKPRHRLSVGVPTIKFPAHLWDLEDTIQGLRAGQAVDCSAWSLAGEWARARHALLDLSDFLLHGAPIGSKGTLVSWFDHPDDQILPGFMGARPGRGVLGRLNAPWRIRVLSAVAQIAIRPDRYKSLALHGYGKGHFLGLSGLPNRTAKRLKHLAACASDDPLMMMLCVSRAEEANELARNSRLWPKALRDRLGSATWVALARHA
ncbi:MULTISPECIES: hypothetical protein [unclassified Caulobacter]|uniref:hypothetical protein n=1 Tax=unclassified Caulobacter TaxID=2648921 RepID=UPI0012E3A66C|nr:MULTISPECIES: hypothetical protein [unclassified Caulobacter]